MATKLTLFNLALGKLGVSAAGRINDIAQNHKGRAALDNVYHTQRQRELRRNYWSFAITRRKVRAIQTTDLLVSFPAYDTAHTTNQIILHGTVSFYNLTNVHYRLLAVDGSAAGDPAFAAGQGAINQPDGGWEVYWGPTIATLYDSAVQYYKGELVYLANGASPPGDNEVYLALTDPDIGVTPADGAQWKLQESTFCTPSPYSLPLNGRQYSYVKPRDMLRIAPFDPNRPAFCPDWLVEGDLIVTDDGGPILDVRYVREMTYTANFDAMFTEALACKMAAEIADEMTQSNTKTNTLIGGYEAAIDDARLVNAIEGYSGRIEPDEDDWVTVRYNLNWRGNF